jgi:hypothetical protein
MAASNHHQQGDETDGTLDSKISRIALFPAPVLHLGIIASGKGKRMDATGDGGFFRSDQGDDFQEYQATRRTRND